ncbi:MAG TPA: NAD-dependent epimerase/dehydratase family protein [Thermoanaerobaculia bacterium]|nr:NAD-dependent epimerase/dehydratase family protein [Thermoanaerobaculia bacterium]
MSNQEKDLHVVFGTGPLGRAVAAALVARGRAVRAVGRSARADVPAGTAYVSADASEPAAARAVTLGAAAVYQCAQPAYHRWPEEFPRLQSSILEAAAAAGARLVLADNLYALGDAGRPLTEDLPAAATTRKGRTRGAMAEAALAAHRAGRVRVAIGRASDFYGPGVRLSALGERVFAPLLAGKKAGVLGNPDLPHTYTYIDDFARALVTLGERDEASGGIWNVPSAPTLTTREIVAIAAEEAGVEPRLAAAGRALLSLAGLFNPGAREMLEMFYEFEKPFVVDHSKFGRAFGGAATPHRDALQATLAWYRARKA